jgi:ABC-type bacteriocin/lantibiotic exporter with double-glycine peptidase domain
MTGDEKSGAWFWDEVKSQRKMYTYAALASLLANIFAFIVSLFSMVVYDRILPNGAIESLTALLAGVAILLFLDYFVRQMRSELLEFAGKKIDTVISAKLFKEIILRQDASEKSNSEQFVFENDELEVVYNALSTVPCSVSDVIVVTGFQPSKVQELLSELELEGKAIMNHIGKYSIALLPK